jgi:cytochrome c
MTKSKIIAVAVALSLAVSLSFAQKSKKPKGGKTETAKTAAKGDAAKGKEIFESKCIVCHNADSKDKKIGPGLQGVKDGKLPSGKDATHDKILEVVDAGGGGMPAYKELLTDEEKEDAVAYVLTL